MVTERVDLSITPGREAEFEIAMARGVALLAGAAGSLGVTLLRCVERPANYMLQIRWGEIGDHHTFTNTPDFQTFRAIAGPFFAKPPLMEHYQIIL